MTILKLLRFKNAWSVCSDQLAIDPQEKYLFIYIWEVGKKNRKNKWVDEREYNMPFGNKLGKHQHNRMHRRVEGSMGQSLPLFI